MTDSSPAIFLGIQPVLDETHRIVAYAFQFRSDLSDEVDADADADAETSTLKTIPDFNALGIINALAERKAYLPVSPALVHSDLIESLSPDQFVLELSKFIEVDGAIIDRCRKFKSLGFSLACSDMGDTRFDALLDLVDVIKADPQEISAERIQHLKQWPVKLLATQVKNPDQITQFHTLGFDLFQGYSFSNPVELKAEHPNTSKLELMTLLELIIEDADTLKIEAEFRHDPSLVYNLLKLINSGSSGGRYKVSTLKQAIVILGRQQIQRWLQLLLFVGECGDMNTPLLELAATRGKLMELLAISHSRMDRELHERAFMTGIMSLLDTLLGMPLQQIFCQVSLAEEVESGILIFEGRLGNLLLLVKKMEQNDFKAASSILADLKINPHHLMPAQLEAMHWANSLRAEMSG